MDVVFSKDHKLSILQIAVESIIHSYYQGIQRHCNFFHGLYSIIMRVDSIIFGLCTGSYSNIFYFSNLGTKLNHSKIFKTAGLKLCWHFYFITL